jgi:hypothetical protein
MAALEQFFTADGQPWEPPTAEELVARGAAPVKREFLRPLKPLVEAPPAAAADGSEKLGPNGGKAPEPGVRGGEHGVDKNRTGKSRRQQNKDKKEWRTNGGELCGSLVKGTCTYGDKCRYSHNVDLYLSAKQPDLPGVWPGRCNPTSTRHPRQPTRDASRAWQVLPMFMGQMTSKDLVSEIYAGTTPGTAR